jgi:molybdopterin-containing oxidoreductase family membrane subunit
MWSALGLLGLAAILLLNPKTRRSDSILIVACIALFIGTWIDKGMGLIAGGFIPTPLHQVADYIPTALELLVSMGIYGIGAIILTILFKLVVGVRNENRGMTS